MLKASLSWIPKCAQRANSTCHELALKLSSDLKKTAIGVCASNKSWEWKHFWIENALLWQRQNERTAIVSGEWGQLHDDILDDWNKSEHAEVFLKALNSGITLQEASRKALAALAAQLREVGVRHFGLPGSISRNYKNQFELGEFSTKAQSRLIKLGTGQQVEFFSWDNARVEQHVARITAALSLIKTYSPESFGLFTHFTKRIVPIKQKEFVSYSLQSLPGHSFINIYHRDDLDLMDDLLHENGHHHLNHYLILNEPLREDPDQIYYSPWRRTLRPIRGIYHAHLTFFFALKLYHDLAQALLSNSLEWPHPLTKAEEQKILFRYAEEWTMLEYTAYDLERAINFGQIRPSGVKLLKEMEVERMKLGKIYDGIEKKMDSAHRKKIAQLKITLLEQAGLTRD